MELIWQVLLQFLWRISFGIAAAMTITPARLVPSGFFRVHLWVLLGLNTVPVLALLSATKTAKGPFSSQALALAICAMALSYVGSVFFLYERPWAGKLVLGVLALLSCLLAVLHQMTLLHGRQAWASADVLSGGCVLGSTLTAMLLGHYYLNAPAMQLKPLRQLIWIMAGAVVLRALVCSAGLVSYLATDPTVTSSWWLFLLLRWLAGMVAPLLLALLTMRTLAIPNTQSATGILYAAVIVVFIGELTSQLLSSEASFPL